MPAPIANAISAYANAGRIGAPGSAPREGGGESFADLVAQVTGGLTDALHKGEAASLDAAAGKADLTQVTAAVNNAEIALQAVLAVRDKIIQAYQDISKLSI